MNVLAGKPLISVLLSGALAISVASSAGATPLVPAAKHRDRSACAPSTLVLHAEPVDVPGLSKQQVGNAVAIINAAEATHVPQRGQMLAVMTALASSSLKSADAAPAGGSLFGTGVAQSDASDPADAAGIFYRELVGVEDWQNLTPSLAAHAAQHNLDPYAYARYWARAESIVNRLTTGTGAAGLRNLADRAQQVARCERATLHGRFDTNDVSPYVGDLAPTVLDTRALDYAQNGGDRWYNLCQSFVAHLAGRSSSGYSTALDAWQTFLAEGVAHPVTSPDGVSPPIGAWLYYQSSNPAGHVVTYLGNGQIASTDVFGHGRVGIGPASAITDGPWHLTYLGWAAPWGGR